MTYNFSHLARVQHFIYLPSSGKWRIVHVEKIKLMIETGETDSLGSMHGDPIIPLVHIDSIFNFPISREN